MAIEESCIDYLGCMYKSFDNYTPYIKVPPSTNIGVNVGGDTYVRISIFNGNFTEINYYNSYAGERQITTAAGARALRFQAKSAATLKQSYVVNKTTGEYYFKGSELPD